MVLAATDFWRWQPHPEVWLLLFGVVGLYVYAARALGPRVVPAGTPVLTASHKRWFVLGVILLWVASDWPVHDVAEQYLYSVHMFQHMVLSFLLPPVMLLATPEWLARAVIGDGAVGRWFLKLARPVPAAVAFGAVQLLTHWSVVVNASVSNSALHYLLHTLVVTTAFAVWMPVVSPLPEVRVSAPAQCIHLFIVSIVPMVPAGWLAFAEGVVYDAYDNPDRMFGISVTADQQLAGLIMKLGGGMFLWAIIIVLFFRWVASQDHGTRARRVRVDDHGEVISVDGDRPLTYDDVAGAFDRTPAPPERTGR